MPDINTFQTGAVRESKVGKGDYSLLPPFAEHKLAQLMAENAERIPARNWEKGIPLSSYIDSGKRHIAQYMMGKTDEEHLVRAAWNLMCAVDTVERVRNGLLPDTLLDCGAYQGAHRIEMVSTPDTAIEKLMEESNHRWVAPLCSLNHKCIPSRYNCAICSVNEVKRVDSPIVPPLNQKTPEHCPSYHAKECMDDPCPDCTLTDHRVTEEA